MFSFTVSRRRAWIMALILSSGALWLVRSDQADAGSTPPGEGIDAVGIVSGGNFPDALGVGPAAGTFAVPLILVPTSPPIPAVTAAELVRLDPRTVTIFGGNAAVSTATEDALKTLLPNAAFQRIAGSNRYETNVLLSQMVYPVESWVSIHSSAFVTELVGTRAFHGGTYVYGDGTSTLFAPVQLPHGAKILEFHVGGVDGLSGVDEDLMIFLNRQCPGGPINPIMEVVTSGAPGEFDYSDTTPDAAYNVVDNENCLYFVAAYFTSGDNYLRSVRVRYRLGTP